MDGDEEGSWSLQDNTQELEHTDPGGCWESGELGGRNGTRKRAATSDCLATDARRAKSCPKF
jgi:hypothetical protein